MNPLIVDTQSFLFRVAKHLGELPAVVYDDQRFIPEWHGKARTSFSSCDYWKCVIQGLVVGVFAVLAIIAVGYAIIDFLLWVGFSVTYGILSPGSYAALVIILLVVTPIISVCVFWRPERTSPSKTLTALRSFKDTIADKICVPVVFKGDRK